MSDGSRSTGRRSEPEDWKKGCFMLDRSDSTNLRAGTQHLKRSASPVLSKSVQVLGSPVFFTCWASFDRAFSSTAPRRLALVGAGYSLERLRRFWTSPGRRGRDEKLHSVPSNSEARQSFLPPAVARSALAGFGRERRKEGLSSYFLGLRGEEEGQSLI